MSLTMEGKSNSSPGTLNYVRYLTERSPVSMVAVEGDTHIVRYVNPAFCILAGKERDSLIGHRFAEVVPEQIENGCIQLLDRVHRTGDAENLAEQKHSNEHSTSIFWSYAVWAILDEEEQPSGVMIQITNTSEAALNRLFRESATEEIQEINQELVTASVREQELAQLATETQHQLFESQKLESLGRLAGGIAHDFNNMLTAILGYTELSLTMLPEDSSVLPFLKNVSSAAQRSAELTKQLLMYARKQLVEFSTLDINKVILGMESLLRRTIGEQYKLDVALSRDNWCVTANNSQMEQVLTNLVINARDSMPDGGRILIETACETLNSEFAEHHLGVVPGDYVVYSVSDYGSGMSEEVQSHVFEPFYTTKKVGKGTGLGLATCYGIVKQSSGNIEVISEESEGTTFKVYLPRSVEKLFSDVLVTTTSLATGKEIVLLAEDEDMVRFISAQALRQQGYTVFEADNGVEALKMLDSYSIKLDILVTDVIMPQMGGKELAERILLKHPELKVLYTSGYTDDAIDHQGILDLGVAFLQKPFTPFALAQKVRALLDSTRAESG